MAEQEIELVLKWENQKSFEMTWKKNSEDVISITKNEEQGSIKILWPDIVSICKAQFNRDLEVIGEEMKAP